MNKTAVILMGMGICIFMTGCQRFIPADNASVRSVTAQSTEVSSAESDSSEKTDNVTNDESGESITQNGKTLTVVYESNPTTGYSWEISVSDPKVIKSVSDTYQEDNAAGNSATNEVICGKGGYETFVFEGTGKGTAVITFNYAQHWKGGNKGEIRTVTVETDDMGKLLSVK